MIYDNVDHELVHLLRMSGNEDVRHSLIDVVCLSRKSIFLYVKARTARRGIFRIDLHESVCQRYLRNTDDHNIKSHR